MAQILNSLEAIAVSSSTLKQVTDSKAESLNESIATSDIIVASEKNLWRGIAEYGLQFPPMTNEAKDFLNDVGVKPPLEILLQGKHEHDYVSNLILNTVKYSGSKQLRSLERDFILDLNSKKSNDALPFRALSVLFVSKLFRDSESLKIMSSACRREVEKKQLELGFATEFLFLSHLFHTCVIHVPDLNPEPGSTVDPKKFATDNRMNKVATLIGDLFITKLFSSLAALENCLVTELMMNTLTQISEKVFQNEFDLQNSSCLEVLFKNSFKCAVMLAGHLNEVQEMAGNLGSHFGRAYQISRILRASDEVSMTTSEQERMSDMNAIINTEIENIQRLIQTIPGHSNSIQETDAFIALLKAMKPKYQDKVTC